MLEQQPNGTGAESRPNPLASLDIRPARISNPNELGSARMAWATMREGETIALTIGGKQAGLPEGRIEILSEEIHNPWDKKHMRAPGMTP